MTRKKMTTEEQAFFDALQEHHDQRMQARKYRRRELEKVLDEELRALEIEEGVMMLRALDSGLSEYRVAVATSTRDYEKLHERMELGRARYEALRGISAQEDLDAKFSGEPTVLPELQPGVPLHYNLRHGMRTVIEESLDVVTEDLIGPWKWEHAPWDIYYFTEGGDEYVVYIKPNSMGENKAHYTDNLEGWTEAETESIVRRAKEVEG